MKQPNLNAVISKDIPWGLLFASRGNLDYGYFSAEEHLVAKYLKPSSQVLVIGSGNGREALPICHQAERVVCIDIGRVYLMSGQQLFRDKGVKNTYFLQADMCHLPFAKGSFDFIFFSLYSFAGESRFEVLKNIRSILRPKGLILLCCDTPLYKKIYGSKVPKEVVFISSAQKLKREISSCGFELLETVVGKTRPEYRFAMLRAN
jgi:ubiquinone/menaquinone biosynthesis C-methylase UbiE